MKRIPPSGERLLNYAETDAAIKEINAEIAKRPRLPRPRRPPSIARAVFGLSALLVIAILILVAVHGFLIYTPAGNSVLAWVWSKP